ncbi:multidrug resistance efflux transporter family protein [Paenibacillus chondroitinus]|uniref:Multidrug resistance efflux transporter family protein n=1 Tax=Paenibacillus chondroitinus TaxID=59842 RepID=A0ABU6DAI8_9BACL|nr:MULTISPECIES: multidrug resistance efflux transporter family protein [Paenibacillus]MCY9661821.1 multidrug resistance efflux transporter family protein [Paenibacillus anseongense]MEB4793907.1 multidrug resistance efflux transporter family protein [Paenibacillus chondroitinus]
MSSFLPMLYGIMASFFFSFSFIMNRSMELSGGYWVWSATLRYLFMLPLLLLIVGLRGNLQVLLYEIRKQLWVWMGWSFVGFGLFYVPLCFSAAYTPGWLLAATWQITIIAGSLLAPLFKEKLPVQGLLISLLIIIGVIVVQAEHSDQLSVKEDLVGTLPVLLAAFAYPLGNRKMMEVCKERLDTYQRVLGMTIASLPLWIVLSLYAGVKAGAPTVGQIGQSALVAVCSGVIATVLFFTATERVKRSSQQLAAVEATQAGEIIFTIFGEMLFLGAAFPTMLSWTGMCCVIFGVIFHSLLPKNR